MRGMLLISESGQLRNVELTSGTSAITLASANVTFRMSWEAQAGSWKLQVPGEQLRVVSLNGRPYRNDSVLRDGDVISAGAASTRFVRVPAPPVFQGREEAEWPLKKGEPLVFGRASKEGGAEPGRVDLDADDPAISRRHALIQPLGERVIIKDESQYGTLLNGQRFDERPLIVGDRFKIGTYSFEFTGVSIKRVKTRIGGKVDARSLGFEAGGRRILEGVSVEIAPCSFVGILGGSGQGKSTLMNALCGINPATAGEVRIEGEPVGNAASMASSGIGYVPQDDIVHPELTVEQAVAYSAQLRLGMKVPAPEIAALVSETIDRLGLAEHRAKRISNLSGGQRKRVSIATELLDKPAVLFLDEPSSGLDPATEYALMKLLRRLAAHDCTVVCTTHVLGRAYLFDRILFIHGGRLVFNGTPDEACAYFQVESLDQVYVNLAESGKPASQWEQEFHAWKHDSQEPARPAGPPEPKSPWETAQKRGAGYIAALVVQLRRLMSILLADKLNPVFLAAQPILIGILVGWVAEDFVLRLFMCIVATLWFGCSNGAQQIVRERPIFRRERVCGLGLNAYLQSKYVFHGAATILQAVVLLLVTQAAAQALHPYEQPMGEFRQRLGEAMHPNTPAASESQDEDFLAVGEGGAPQRQYAAAARPSKQPDNPANAIGIRLLALASTFLQVRENLLDAAGQPGASVWKVFAVSAGLKFFALAMTAAIGVAMGLAISGIVQTGTQAVMWVPLILIPQILFGGVVLKRPELSRAARILGYLSPSYSCQRLIDVSNIYGQAVPLLSNRTKVPLFLTAGEKESVSWTVSGKQYSEKYDKLSHVNTSWQNLAIMPSVVGEHRNEFTTFETATGSTRKIYKETTDVRNDVLYRKGALYGSLAPAGRSILCLAMWIAACYGATVAALIAWQKGK